jgi:hypothetical protein
LDRIAPVSPAPTPPISVLDLNKKAGTADYTLTYSGLSSSVTVAHIHFGKVHVAGGIIAFLCGGGGQAACPSSGMPWPATLTSKGEEIMRHHKLLGAALVAGVVAFSITYAHAAEHFVASLSGFNVGAVRPPQLFTNTM